MTMTLLLHWPNIFFICLSIFCWRNIRTSDDINNEADDESAGGDEGDGDGNGGDGEGE
jgi:hypothetical protein